ncbi:serum amyloid P-component-like [Clupea harengus]|uniref:Pentraxin family member n=1 Tax=Clupea harengus TaxID=7950 RepID=A0A6P3VZ47_CLUHA|nr:serum amyloid P-component-like [Clupea harengus]
MAASVSMMVFIVTHFITSFAEKQDLSGQMFTFPVESDTAHVILVPNQSKSLTAVTVCLRFFSDLTRAQSLFSFATPTNENAFLLFKGVNNVYEVDQGGENVVLFWGLEDKRNEWNSVCVTWNSQTGIAQVWVNGKGSTRKGLRRGGDISGMPSIILGQDQDSYGGKFDKGQSFVGMITDVHMWDSVLPYPEIALYMNRIQQKTDGHVINWRSLDFTTKGYVIVEEQVN